MLLLEYILLFVSHICYVDPLMAASTAKCENQILKSGIDGYLRYEGRGKCGCRISHCGNISVVLLCHQNFHKVKCNIYTNI